MDRATRSELLKTIEAQKDKLQKYETKLRDVVLAYKGMLKEKEALERSVQILSQPSPRPPRTNDGVEAHVGSHSTSLDQGQSSTDPLSVDASPNEEFAQLKAQLSTLSESLATVTQEKSKMEANYQADKRRLRLENETAMSRSEEQKAVLEKQLTDVNEQIQELRNRVRKQQHEREKEQNDHAMMLRELQKLLSQERIAKEQLEHQLDEAKQSLEERKPVPVVADHSENRVAELKIELENLQRKLKLAEDSANTPSLAIKQLQEQLAQLTAERRLELQNEQLHTEEAERRGVAQSTQNEERVASLEAKVSEMSQLLGNYDKLRYQDQRTMQKLRERITQLDLENTALARAAHKVKDMTSDPNMEDDTTDIQVLVNRIVKLKGLLILANDKSDRPVNVDEILSADLTLVNDSREVHRTCVDEYEQLREEFERYKLRAQSVLKNKSSKETGTKEVDTLKGQVGELRERLRLLHIDMEEREEQWRRKEEDLQGTITSLHTSHKAELSGQEAEYKQRLGDLEMEMRRHRDRTISLLAEKDSEIDVYRAKVAERYEPDLGVPYRHLSTQSTSHESSEVGASSEETAVSQLLARASTLGGTPAETSLLHFAQEQARRDVEINSLRKQKHSLESALRDLQHSSSTKEQTKLEQIEHLEEEIRKLERNKSRESADLEYLKNVVYKFIICTDSPGKQQMLNAIATILEFSPKEKESAHNYIVTGWWGVHTGTYIPPQTTRL